MLTAKEFCNIMEEIFIIPYRIEDVLEGIHIAMRTVGPNTTHYTEAIDYLMEEYEDVLHECHESFPELTDEEFNDLAHAYLGAYGDDEEMIIEDMLEE